MSVYIARSIKNANEEQTHSIEVMAYAIFILLNTSFIIVMSLSLGGIMGNLYSVLTALLSLLIIRMVSGGPHIRTAWGCNIVSVLLCVIAPIISLYIPVHYLNLFNTVVMLLFSPQPDSNTKMPAKFYPHLKTISVALAASNFFINDAIIAFVIFIQAVLILPLRKGVRT